MTTIKELAAIMERIRLAREEQDRRDLATLQEAVDRGVGCLLLDGKLEVCEHLPARQLLVVNTPHWPTTEAQP